MDNKYQYNPWPIGQVPEELQRPELRQLKEKGYQFDDPREVIDLFEQKVAKFAGSKYAVAVDCCTHAIELCFRLLLDKDEIKKGDSITIPLHTYVSAALIPMQLGLNVRFADIEWSGKYRFRNTRIWDAAVRWNKGMFIGNESLQCVSFQIKKRIPIGRGGVILLNSEEEYRWLKLASYDGRDLSLPYTHPEHLKMQGWHYYMTPEDAARGIILMDAVPDQNPDTGDNAKYPNVKIMLGL